MWRDYTAMTVHYFTQPLPSPLSYYAHRMPLALHKLSVVATFTVEILLPFLIWIPSSVARFITLCGFGGLNAVINLTGNYGFIGFLNTMENMALLDDGIVETLFGGYGFRDILVSGIFATSSMQQRYTYNFVGYPIIAGLSLLLLLYIQLSLFPLMQSAKGGVAIEDAFHNPLVFAIRRVTNVDLEYMFATKAAPTLRKLYSAQHPFHLINYQGKFSSMHDFRYEIIIEGQQDNNNTWKEYLWKYKPDAGLPEGSSRPKFCFLHLPRLDWMTWFLPLRARSGGPPPSWFAKLLHEIQRGNPDVLRLFAHNPFPNATRDNLRVRTRVLDFVFEGDSWWETRPVSERRCGPLLMRAMPN